MLDALAVDQYRVMRKPKALGQAIARHRSQLQPLGLGTQRQQGRPILDLDNQPYRVHLTQDIAALGEPPTR